MKARKPRTLGSYSIKKHDYYSTTSSYTSVLQVPVQYFTSSLLYTKRECQFPGNAYSRTGPRVLGTVTDRPASIATVQLRQYDCGPRDYTPVTEPLRSAA